MTLQRRFFVQLPWLPTRPKETSVQALGKLVAHAKADADLVGIVLSIPHLRAGWATLTGVRVLIEELRASGKQVVAYLPQGGGNKELWLATAADRVLVSPQATLGPLGLAASRYYFRPLLERLGLEVEVEARKGFKTAAEPATRDEMSPEQREQTEALLRAVHTQLALGIASRVGAERVDEIIEGTLYLGEAAVKAGLVDATVYEDQLLAAVTGRAPDKKEKLGDGLRYLNYYEARLFRPLRRKPYVAIIPVHGAITAGASYRPGREPGADLEQVTKAIRAVSRDRRAVGAVLHISSPGGSALASDLILQEVRALQRKKPVVAAFGDVAASGGYYVAASADTIVAQPLTITGSIGVIMAKVVAEKALAKLGVSAQTVRLSPHSDLFEPHRSLSDAEKRILGREADGFYEAFVTIVAQGRDKPFDDIEPLARGRVWAGDAALENGLVDVSGGILTAIDEVKKRVEGLPASAWSQVEARAVVPSGRMPPIEQATLPAALAWLGGLNAATRDATDVMSLALGGERALYYATGIPQVS